MKFTEKYEEIAKKLPETKDIFLSPLKTFVPTDISVNYAVVTNLAYEADTEERMLSALKYITRIVNNGAELVSLFVNTNKTYHPSLWC